MEFRLIVFRPYKGEILQGVILESSSPSGLRIGLDFFFDIWIPAQNLPPEAKLLKNTDDTSPDEFTWVWDPNDDPETAFWYDLAEIVRFRVEEEVWSDSSPERPDFVTSKEGDLSIRAHVAAGGFEKDGDEKGKALKRSVPYAVIGSMQVAGLGCVHWWRSEEGGEGEEGDAEGGADVEMGGDE
jgi:DNA-directed RNA polymerase III subunit RPC8